MLSRGSSPGISGDNHIAGLLFCQGCFINSHSKNGVNQEIISQNEQRQMKLVVSQQLVDIHGTRIQLTTRADLFQPK